MALDNEYRKWLEGEGIYPSFGGGYPVGTYKRFLESKRDNTNPGGGTLSTVGGAGGGGASSARTTPTGFNLNPAPTGGQGAYGLVPGPLGLPDPHGDLARVLPGLDGLNASASANIMAQLGGQLSPETQAALANMAAERGVAGGMPGAQTWDHLLLGNVAGAMEGLRQQGIQNYNQFVPTVSRTQTVSPELQADIANQNAINAAAPDPAAAAAENERLYAKYLNGMRGPGGGTGGGGFNPGGGTRGGGIGLPSLPSFNPAGSQPRGVDPTKPSWGQASNNAGGFATYGNVPTDQFDYDAWEGPTNNNVNKGAPYGSNFWDEFNSWSF